MILKLMSSLLMFWMTSTLTLLLFMFTKVFCFSSIASVCLRLVMIFASSSVVNPMTSWTNLIALSVRKDYSAVDFMTTNALCAYGALLEKIYFWSLTWLM